MVGKQLGRRSPGSWSGGKRHDGGSLGSNDTHGGGSVDDPVGGSGTSGDLGAGCRLARRLGEKEAVQEEVVPPRSRGARCRGLSKSSARATTPPILHCPSLHHASPEEPGPISRGLEGARPSHSVRRERLSRRAFERGAHPRAAAGPAVVVHSRQRSSPAAATRRAVSAPTGGLSARVPPGLSGAWGARADHEMHLARAPSELLAFERWSRWTTSVDVAGVWRAAEFAQKNCTCKNP